MVAGGRRTVGAVVLAVLAGLLPLVAWVAPAAAAGPQQVVGSPIATRPFVDGRPDATVVNLTNTTATAGAISAFRWYAERPGTVRFVVVEPATTGHPRKVQWVSPPLAIAAGAAQWAPPQHVVTAPGAAIGVHWTGSSPFNFSDSGPVTGVTQPMGAPVAGGTLAYDPVVNGRSYSVQAVFVPDAFVGTTWFETRQWNGVRPTSAASAVATYNASPQPAGYCSKQVASINGASNQLVCGGTSSNIGYHASVDLDVFTAGTWEFRLGPDFGGGGALLVDGTPIDFRANDIWWNGNFDVPTQHFAGSIALATGPHTFELYGFDGCCDGAWGAQIKAPGGAWVPLTSDGTTTSLRPQTIVFGSTPPANPVSGASYAVQANGGGSGNPVVLTLGPSSVGVCRLIGSTVELQAPGTCVVLADQAGNASYLPATQAQQTIVVQNAAPVLPPLAAVTLEAAGPDGAPLVYLVPAASDVEDRSVRADCSPAPGSWVPIGTSTVVCTATDSHGGSASSGFTVTVADRTGPAVTAGDVVAEATGPDGAHVEVPASAFDLVDGPLAPTCVPPSGTRFPLGTTTVTCSATDGSGNDATPVAVAVTVRDTTAPFIAGTLAVERVEATGPDGAVVEFEPLGAVDLVDGIITATCSPSSGSVLPLGATEVTCTATDDAGNSSTSTSTVVVGDGTAPTISAPGDLVVEATGPDGADVGYDVRADDTVGGELPVECSTASGDTFPLGGTTVTCSAVDDAGNEASATFAVHVVDTTAPVAQVPLEWIFGATEPGGADVEIDGIATDAVDGEVDLDCDDGLRPVGTHTVTCRAVDAAGNLAEVAVVVTVSDVTAPELDVPGTVVLEATGADGAPAEFVATAFDVVDGDLDVVCSPASGSTFALGTTSVSCTAADTAGNVASAELEVVVRDTTAPVLDLPADLVVEATGPDGAPALFAATATDVVDGDLPVACSVQPGSVLPLGETTVSCSVEDARANQASGSFAVAVRDTTAPAAPVLTDVTAEATGPDGAAVGFAASLAADVVDGDVVAVCDPASGDVVALGTSSATCTYTDAAGNRSSSSFSITVEDTTAPTVAALEDVVAEATGPDGAVVTYSVDAADDAVSGAVPVDCTPASGSTFAIGSATVRCTATDDAGNTGSSEFVIAVSDTTGPLVVVPIAASAEAIGPAGAPVTFSASAHDVVDGDLVPACSPVSGSTFGLGATTVTCSAADSRGNAGSAGFEVTVVDTTAPVLELSADLTVEATSGDGADVAYTAAASDVVDGALEPVCSAASGATFALGATVVRCDVADAHGNASTGSFTVTVVDTTAPAVHVPSDLVAEATSPGGAVVSFASAAADVVDGALATACAPASGSTFALGTTTVTCTATDAAGNTGAASFAVDVRDTTAPVITFTGNAGTYDVDGQVVIGCTVHDAVSTGLNCASTIGSAWTFPLGPNVVTRTAVDAAGNGTTASTTFVVAPTSVGMCALTTSLVSKHGIANSLCVKLRAGSFRAYRNELSAQAGKAIARADAARLSAISLELG